MNTIMVPLDGSAFGEQALPLALTFARRLGAAVHLVTVETSWPPSVAFDESVRYVRGVAEQIGSQVPAGVRAVVLTDELGALHYPPQAPDTVAEVLAAHARRHEAKLIVMATHGRSGVRRAWLGSIANALLRIAPRPLLLVRPDDERFSTAASADRGINHILIPLDGSEAAEQSIAVARDIARRFDARMTLLRVTSPLSLGFSDDPADGYPLGSLTPIALRSAAAYVDDVGERLRIAGFGANTCVVQNSSPARAIIEYATTHAADLIILTTVGAGGMRRLLLGSVADEVVRHGECPVLLCNTSYMQSCADEPFPTAAAAAVDPEC